MKHTICVIAIIAGILFAQTVHAQDTLATQKKKPKKYGTTISLGTKGLEVRPHDSSFHTVKKIETRPDTGFSSHWVMLDIGFNTMQDKSNYNSADAKNFLNVPSGSRNSSLFNLKTGKSINVNIYPFMETFSLLHGKKQDINISTGIGLQLYNFSYESPINFNRNPNSISLDSISLKKDKLGFDFLNIPLMLTFKTKLYGKAYLVYGIGITGGYNLATWTKQESGEFGKVKVHDNYDFATFNSCLTGELGILKSNSTGVRLYGSYQLTNLYNSGLNQHPITIGIRFFAI